MRNGLRQGRPFLFFGHLKRRHVFLELNRSGLTMLETLIGIALFALALFGTLNVMNQSLAMNKTSQNRTLAMNDARRILEEVRREVEAGGLSSVTSGVDWAQFLAANLENQAVAVTFPQGTGLNPLPVQIAISWTEKGKASTYAVDTLVTQRG